MNRLYLLCGAPFSGKSTLAQAIASKTASQYVSLDNIMRQRGLDLSHVQPIEEWARAHQICLQQLAELMSEDLSIVLDDTNYLKWLRDDFRSLAEQHQYHIITVYLNIPLKELERRRSHVLISPHRNSLPDDAFYPIIRDFEVPGEDEQPRIFDGTISIDEWIEKNVVKRL